MVQDWFRRNRHGPGINARKTGCETGKRRHLLFVLSGFGTHFYRFLEYDAPKKSVMARVRASMV